MNAACIVVFLAFLVFLFVFFFFNDTATTEIYTLSLHDALPILEQIDRIDQFLSCRLDDRLKLMQMSDEERVDLVWTMLHGEDDESIRGRYDALYPLSQLKDWLGRTDRKSTRLNSSHRCISYAVFCLKKKKNNNNNKNKFNTH